MKNSRSSAHPRHRRFHFAFFILHLIEKSVEQLAICAVRFYRITLSPAQKFIFGSAAGCRFTPSCSQYAIEALQTHGALRGSWLAIARVCRCHPWGECGCDPVPPKKFQVRGAEVTVFSSAPHALPTANCSVSLH